MSFHPETSIFYVDHFLSRVEHQTLDGALAALPVGTPQERWAADTLMLAPPVSDDVVVQGRLEGAAGWPIWSAGSAVRGPAMPDVLADLARRVGERLATDGFWSSIGSAPEPFTSVYVDRYPSDGHFVPHTDRDCYGPVVACVSGGVGSCQLHFSEPSGGAVSFTLRPGSLYAFTGPLRHHPWVHSVDGVDGVRYAISMRNAAPELLATVGRR
jgi:hypothetical protein